jgi:hypothetical protein
MPTTKSPLSKSLIVKAEPIKPALPVTKIFIFSQSDLKISLV